jgi:hypothetical protein
MEAVGDANYTVSPSLDPNRALPAVPGKADVTQWELALKKEVCRWMADPQSPFDALKKQLRGQSFPKPTGTSELTESTSTTYDAQTGVKTGPLVSSRSASRW